MKLDPRINSLQLPTRGKKNRQGPSILDRFPGCCDCVESLKDDPLKIPIDAEEQPVAQPIRRFTYHHRDKLTGKLKDMLEIVEKVSGPRSCVSPVSVVPKPTGDNRLHVDMR